MNHIATQLQKIRTRITAAEQHCGRPPHSVKLLAVSKTHPAADLRLAIAAQQHCFGENYAQEALEKMALLAAERLEWHFIGDIQANKAKVIAQNFSWVHSISRLKIAQRLNEYRTDQMPPLNICLQVNVSQESSKAGISFAELPALALAVSQLPHLKLRGLMTIPAACADFAQQRLPYRQLRAALVELQNKGLCLDTLSMGMTNDLEAAIAEGSTLLRIGTAIFGERVRNHE
jgi:pyridoxal phosphate enzyme (YggS family)